MTLWKIICRFLEKLGLLTPKTESEQSTLTEYERLSSKLGLASSNVSLADLDDSQITSLATHSALDRRQIENLRASARLARVTRLPAEILYVFVREDPTFDVDRLLKLEPAEIETALTSAVRANVIPARFKDAVSSVNARLDEIRLEKGLLVRRAVVVSLSDKSNAKPLPGLNVHVFETGAKGEVREIASDLTDVDGLFSFSYVSRSDASGKRRFDLSINNHRDQKLVTSQLEVEIGKDETYPVTVALPVPEVVSPAISKFPGELGLVIKPELQSVLDKHKILTLADVLATGGLSQLPELGELRDDEMVKRLDQHANLSLLPSDIKANALLIDKGYDSIHAIAAATLKDVERAVPDKTRAAQIYHAAKAQAHYLDHLATEQRVAKRNGRPATMGLPDTNSEADNGCQCEDCKSAVSPLAYLADLLDYAVTHVKDNGNPISLSFLSSTFHQAFEQLPRSCASAEEKLRQVRIAVEVLRELQPAGQQLDDALGGYVLEAYKAMLLQLGTSYDELRLTVNAAPEKRAALRDRLAIQRRDGTANDELNELLLSPDEQTERSLERLFGLHDTVPDHRFSRGAEIFDLFNRLDQWTFDNVAWGRTTDVDGRIYVQLPNLHSGEVKVFSKGSHLIASGQLEGGADTVVLAEENTSGVSGEISVAPGPWVPGPGPQAQVRIGIAAIPEFLSWRLNQLRTQWLAHDWPAASYVGDSLPIIDPDLLGPDDFRNPVAGDEAFDLWLKRSAWRDQRLMDLSAKMKVVGGAIVPDFDQLRDLLINDITYATKVGQTWLMNPGWKDLESLNEKLADGSNSEVAVGVVKDILHLTVESFSRLMAIKARTDAWENGGANEPVSADESQEVVSILTQAQKTVFFDLWQREESAELFRAKSFWISLSEPREGTWPVSTTPEQPWIDPDTVKENDLPDSVVGDRARALLAARRTELEDIFKRIKQARETGDFEAMLVVAFGPAVKSTWSAKIDQLKNDLTSSDQAVADAARRSVKDDLHLSEVEFDQLALLKAKAANADPAKRLTVAEWDKLYSLLTQSMKLHERFPDWIKVENNLAFDYWNFRKARLPRWRSSVEARAAWQRALRDRTRLPIVDPDLIGLDDLFASIAGNPAYDFWRARRAESLTQEMFFRSPGNSQNAINSNLTETLGVADLDDLKKKFDEGEVSRARLEQLTIRKAELDYALRIRELAKTGTPTSSEEMEILYAILIQVYKRRNLFSKWRREERSSGLTLRPDYFQLAPAPTYLAPQATPPQPSPWRVNSADRRNWEDTLQSRIDQEQSLINAHWSAVTSVEEAALPGLRNRLVRLVGHSSLATTAKSLTDLLLLDMAAGGCQITTRAGQAIETVQTLIWSLRTGQLKDSYPNLELDADDFEEEWKWLGSYATWRAAMLVFLYPENVLLPTLRRQRTQAFQKLIESLGAAPKLTADAACKAGREYSQTFRDLFNLKVEATCEARTWVSNSSCAEKTAGVDAKYCDLFYMFARSTLNGLFYWSTLDLSDGEVSGGSSWAMLPGLAEQQVKRIIGAAPHKLSDGSRFVYLFCETKTQATGQRGMGYLRYNLEDRTQRWSEEFHELPISLVFDGTNMLESISNDDSPIVMRQIPDEEATLRFALHAKKNEWDHGFVIGNELDEAGVDFAYDQWREWHVLRYHRFDYVERVDGRVTLTLTSISGTLIACLAQKTDADVFFFQANEGILNVFIDGTALMSFVSDDTIIERAKSDWIFLHPIDYFGQGEWQGAVAHRDGVRVAFDELYVIKLEARGVWVDYRSQGQVVGNIAVHNVQTLDSGWNLVSQFPGFGPFFKHLDFVHEPNREVNSTLRIRVTPNKVFLSSTTAAGQAQLEAALELNPNLSSAELQLRREIIAASFLNNVDSPKSVRIFLDEAYLFVPLVIALRLKRDGQYLAALDWFRLIYDYSIEVTQRWIYSLPPSVSSEDQYERIDGWLADPINPHAIAEVRPEAHLRFVLISLVSCFLDFADAEFTEDTPASIPHARQLYQTALELLDTDEIRQEPDVCQAIIGELVIAIPESKALRAALDGSLRGLPAGDLKAAADQIKSLLASEKPAEEQLVEVRKVVADAQRSQPASLNLGQIQQKSLSSRAAFSLVSLAHGSIARTTAEVGALAVSKSSRSSWHKQKSSENRTDRLISSRQKSEGSAPQLLYHYFSSPSFHFCISANPLIPAFRLRADLNLLKIRTCRNIAGLERQIDPYGAATDVASGLPAIGAAGQIMLPGAVTLRPTLYRFRVLIDRAKQFAGIAQQMETTFLSLLERLDAEDFSLLRARQDARAARASVRLQDLRAQEADRGVKLAELQRQLSVIQEEHYSSLIAEGNIDEEDWALNLLGATVALQFGVATIRAGAIILAGAGVDVSAAGTTFGTGSLMATIASAATDQIVLQSVSGGLSSWSAALSTIASQKRRDEEWGLQQELAQQNILIGDQQITLANDRVRIVGQEREISVMQADHADEVVEFLNTKFTSRDLYDWMSNILEGVYRYFLQQATSIARVAENQLAFERQQVPPALIQGDYWTSPSEGAASVDPDAGSDRRGLTGSARLVQDIHRLDQYAFETDQRKLQLTKTISLARLDSVAFQRFIQLGVMIFATPMRLYDRDFPGHYLRLIKRVRTSVIALIPPTEGIKATLSTLGTSRVVIGGDVFQTTGVNRGPESVALSSPINATGLFELEAQTTGEMLFPFEGMGVDASWEFRMPKAANYFDYSSIADVLVTIEYTALDSFVHRDQILQQLDRRISSDRPFTFRHQFADQWYDFHNPDTISPPQRAMTVSFATRREDFPANVDELKVEHVTMYFAFKEGVERGIEVTLSLTEQGSAGPVSGSASSPDGLISTRQGNGASWTKMTGLSPVGDWELALPDTEEMKDRFHNGEIEDILFVITFGGTTPSWPK